MAGPVPRRDFLRGGALTAAALAGGCLLNNPGATAGNVYVENTSGRQVRVGVLVAEAGDEATAATAAFDNPVVQGWYEVAEGTALEIVNVLREGTPYVVQAALDGAPQSDRVRASVEPCEDDPDAERTISVRTRPDGVGVVPWGCQESYTQRDMEYVEADEHLVGTVSGTVAPPAGEADTGDGNGDSDQ